MPQKPVSPPESPTLRERAEGTLRVSPPDITGMSATEIQKLVHELQVHQIELQIQNEELRAAQAELAHSRDRFNDLYDFAPVGYLTTDQAGTLIDVNLTAATMLGVERKFLVGRRFSQFVAAAAQDTLYLHQQVVLAAESKRSCELVLLRADGTHFSVRMESISVPAPGSPERHCRHAIIDITKRQQAEASLQLNERRFRALIEQAGEYMTIVDGQGTVTYERPGATGMLGYPPNEFRGRAVFEVVHPEDLSQVRQRFTLCLRAPGQAERAEFRALAQNGEWRWIHATATNLLHDPAVRGVVLNSLDITERKQAELALQNRSERLTLLSDAASALLTATEPAMFLNGIFARLSELLRLEVCIHYRLAPSGRQLELVVCRGLDEAVLPRLQRLELGQMVCGTVAATGQPLVLEDVQHLTQEYAAQIQSLGLQAYASHPLLAKGHLVGTLSFGTRERTRFAPDSLELIRTVCNQVAAAIDRKQAEEALMESEAKYRRLHETMRDAFVVSGMDGRISECNAAYSQLLGYSEVELKQLTYLDLTPTKWHEEERVIVTEQVLRRGHSEVYEKEYRRKDGTILPVELRTSLIRDDGGEPTGMWAIVRDITERKQIKAALQRAKDELEERVAKRTAELARTNARLTAEIAERAKIEEALRESETRFRQMSEGIEQVFWMTDVLKERVLYVSPGYERIWGRACQSLYDAPLTWLEAIHPDDQARVRELALTKQSAGDFDLEYRIRRPDGQERWIRDHAFPIRDKAGRVYRIAGIAEDITERKRLQEEILASGERERERLGHNLHDGLCQLLTAARLKADSLATRLAKQEPAIVRSVKSVTNLIAQSLEEARQMARGLDPVEPLPEGLMAALQALAKATTRLFNAHCTCEFPQPVLVANHKVATELFRIAQEATHNAVKHGRAADIRIRFAEEAGTVVLSVVSDGKPFPNRRRSIGMGLKTMRFRADRIGATFDIQRGLRKGTIVRCALPLSLVAAPDATSNSPSRKVSGIAVLAAEADGPDTRKNQDHEHS